MPIIITVPLIKGKPAEYDLETPAGRTNCQKMVTCLIKAKNKKRLESIQDALKLAAKKPAEERVKFFINQQLTRVETALSELAKILPIHLTTAREKYDIRELSRRKLLEKNIQKLSKGGNLLKLKDLQNQIEKLSVQDKATSEVIHIKKMLDELVMQLEKKSEYRAYPTYLQELFLAPQTVKSPIAKSLASVARMERSGMREYLFTLIE
ncbi:MAG: hypothetical protein A3H43_00555 [Gammaproteobacteria bacterium RIFCSPLOWO2_02_FULL_42_9]|nr:MAG: hypothetical protein A3H43_00555 [Gammaproteobacteria bacterium RIFCSPLOWO2_02_FULL_42_9]